MLKNIPYDKFKEIYSQVTRLSVEVVIVREGKILLTLRDKLGWVGQWHTPGGTVLYREPVEDAVKRIAETELGVSVNVDKLLGYFEAFSEESERGFGYSISLAFLCTPDSYDFRLDTSARKFDFFDQIPANTVIEHKEFYSKALNLKQ